MATSSAQSNISDSRETCCSSCSTVFQVSLELLESSDTRVRCGECFAIFDARVNLVEDSERSGADAVVASPAPSARIEDTVHGKSSNVASLAGLANDTSALDVTYSDFDLFSEDADLPEVAYFDQTRDTPEFDFDSVELDEDETFSDTLFVNDVTVDARTGDHTPLDDVGNDAASTRSTGSTAPSVGAALMREVDVVSEATPRAPLQFQYRDPEPGSDEPDVEDAASGLDESGHASVEPLLFDPPAVRRSLLLPSVLLLALALVLAALYGYQRRDRLADDPLTRPVYIVYCRAIGCTVPPRSALDRIELVRRNVYSHPDIDDALVIDVSFRNVAPFAQAWPALVVRLSDPSGRLVARRAFEPGEYLPDTLSDEVIAGGARQNVSLDVNDPGQDASSFEVDFVPARAPRIEPR